MTDNEARYELAAEANKLRVLLETARTLLQDAGTAPGFVANLENTDLRCFHADGSRGCEYCDAGIPPCKMD